MRCIGLIKYSTDVPNTEYYLIRMMRGMRRGGDITKFLLALLCLADEYRIMGRKRTEIREREQKPDDPYDVGYWPLYFDCAYRA